MTPEVFLCSQCGNRINLDADEYVVPNRSNARHQWQLVYAHARCVEGRAGKLIKFAAKIAEMSDAELEQEYQGRNDKTLEAKIASMSDEELRRFGLWRIDGDADS